MELDMPKYSFVIPVYNCRRYLKECVDSILTQTVSDFEILLIDDGSEDGSATLCDEYSVIDKRIRVFHKENGGAASARNAGVEHAAGTYILFVDGDDTVEPNCLELVDPLLQDVKTMPVFGMCFDYWRGNELKRTELCSVAFPGECSVNDLTKSLSAFFDDNVLSSACNKVFPTRLLREHRIRFPESVRLYEDLTFVLSCLPFFEKIHVIGRGLYHYRNQLEKAHINDRVADLDRMRADSVPLNNAFFELGKTTNHIAQCASVSANLYLMLLEQHLLSVSSGARALCKKLPRYVSEEGFREALRSGAQLQPAKQELLTMIEQKKYSSIRRTFSMRRFKSRLRRTAKRLLGR